MSDILFNSSAKVVNASYFRKFFENKLPEICQDLLEAHKNIQQRLKAEQFKVNLTIFDFVYFVFLE